MKTLDNNYASLLGVKSVPKPYVQGGNFLIPRNVGRCHTQALLQVLVYGGDHSILLCEGCGLHEATKDGS